MSFPTLAVRIGVGPQPDALLLDDATYGKLDTGGVLGDGLSYEWDDITDSVREQSAITIQRGATNNRGPYLSAEAGTLTFKLDNRTSTFDPFHEGTVESGTGVSYGGGAYGSGTYGTTLSDSPYWIDGESILRPGLPVSVQATLDGVVYDLFTGKVTAWNVSYPEKAFDSVVTVTASDAVADLAQSIPAEVFEEQGASETPSARFARLLDAIGWPNERRNIDDADATPLLSTFLGRPVWEEMQSAADAVNGYLWVDASGSVRFQGKSQFPRAAEFAIGEGTAAVTASEIMVSNDIAQLYNVVALAREDGNTQTVTDASSIDKYGRRSFDRSGLPLETDEAVGVSLTYILSQHKNHRLRLDGFEVKMHSGRTQTEWQTMLTVDVLARPTASFTTPHGNTITREGLVRGVGLNIRETVWTWTIDTSAAPESLGDFTLDDGSLGLLDTGVLAAF